MLKLSRQQVRGGEPVSRTQWLYTVIGLIVVLSMLLSILRA
ncbi:MAG TPA: hypothetical protein VFE37_03860 [Chloroflexota bacterium]|nr:hypothetical protein [Chloroflexota bacterium]